LAWPGLAWPCLAARNKIRDHAGREQSGQYFLCHYSLRSVLAAHSLNKLEYDITSEAYLGDTFSRQFRIVRFRGMDDQRLFDQR
jgi:hypothetical protein